MCSHNIHGSSQTPLARQLRQKDSQASPTDPYTFCNPSATPSGSHLTLGMSQVAFIEPGTPSEPVKAENLQMRCRLSERERVPSKNTSRSSHTPRNRSRGSYRALHASGDFRLRSNDYPEHLDAQSPSQTHCTRPGLSSHKLKVIYSTPTPQLGHSEVQTFSYPYNRTPGAIDYTPASQ